MVPQACTTGTLTSSDGSQYKMTKPLVYFALYNANTGGVPLYHKYYTEKYAQPIVIKEKDYSAGKFSLIVQYKWFSSPARDYTVKIYSKHEVQIKD